jgi:hypothetical protein
MEETMSAANPIAMMAAPSLIAAGPVLRARNKDYF